MNYNANVMRKIILFCTVFLFLIGCNSESTKKNTKQIDSKTEEVKKAIDLNDYRKPKQLKELVDSPNENIWIIDVRTENEYESGHIPTAKLFPKDEIDNRLNELPKDKYYILYCLYGGRSGAAVKILLDNGYDSNKVINWGGIRDWPYEKVEGK